LDEIRRPGKAGMIEGAIYTRALIDMSFWKYQVAFIAFFVLWKLL